MAGLNSGLASNVVRTALDRVLFEEFSFQDKATASAEDGLVFKQDSTDRSAVISEQFMGAGYFQSRGELQDVVQGTNRVGNQKTSSVVNYSKGIKISKNLFDDDQHAVVEKSVRDLGRLARVSRDRNALSVYNNGFSSQTSNDAVALFSNSHTTLGGQTVDNLETGALTLSNLETGINSLLQQQTQDGTLGGHSPAVLLVPTALLREAMQITGSSLIPGSANNDINYLSEVWPGLQVRWSPFLSTAQGGSDTAWFILSRDHSITRFIRQPLQTILRDWQFSENLTYQYIAEYREVVDSISWEGVVGSNGTT